MLQLLVRLATMLTRELNSPKKPSVNGRNESSEGVQGNNKDETEFDREYVESKSAGGRYMYRCSSRKVPSPITRRTFALTGPQLID